MKDFDGYLERGRIIGIVAAVPTFFILWIYCIAEYGFLLGVGLGWLPSFIVAALAFIVISFLWPLFLLAIAAIAIALLSVL